MAVIRNSGFPLYDILLVELDFNCFISEIVDPDSVNFIDNFDTILNMWRLFFVQFSPIFSTVFAIFSSKIYKMFDEWSRGDQKVLPI